MRGTDCWLLWLRSQEASGEQRRGLESLTRSEKVGGGEIQAVPRINDDPL